MFGTININVSDILLNKNQKKYQYIDGPDGPLGMKIALGCLKPLHGV